MRWTLALWLVLSAPASAQTFSGTDEQIRAAVCPPRGGCVVESVLAAGRHGVTDLAVVRVRAGRRVCVDQAGYRDFLVSARGGVVRRERLLVRGECPCLEWSLSRWTYRRGELVFRYGHLGAPMGADDDARPTTLHLRPWPLAIVGAEIGDDPSPPPALPERGPIVVLTME